jgi:hypothetical protein
MNSLPGTGTSAGGGKTLDGRRCVVSLHEVRSADHLRPRPTKRRNGHRARPLSETGVPLHCCRPRFQLIRDPNRPGEVQLPDVRVSCPYAHFWAQQAGNRVLRIVGNVAIF